MPSLEVWGPAVWTLFHTLAERVHEDAYPFIAKELFGQIVRICNVLPCPDCSTDASNFLAKITISTLKTKTDFKNLIYLFHNYVNAKKRKPLFNVMNLNMYNNYKLIPVVNNFLVNFNTKGNMNLINESFQRTLVINSFKKWISRNLRGFTSPNTIKKSIVEEPIVEEVVAEESIVEEPIVEETIVEKTIVEQVVVEEVVAEEVVAEEELIVEEVVAEEVLVEEVVAEEVLAEETIVEEEPNTKEPVKNKKKNKNNKWN